ncbi:MAG: zinc ribbon domain-containing protein [Campylobacteraceae bacterium]|jgi:hypothetical protein|nr:zinc ribbon domain-containing protein [Campylobacteraceae bacterium]
MYDDLKAQIEEKQARWFAFLDKLTIKAKELYEPAFEELANIRKADGDPNKSTYNKALSGVCGQFGVIAKKAHDTLESEIIDFYYDARSEAISQPLSSILYEFKNTCYERFYELEESLLNMERALRDDAKADLEEEYAKIIDAFNGTRDKLLCSQCGHLLPIDRIFCISVHIACPACGAQNTFEPSPKTRNLQFIAKELAEKRCKHLLDAYGDEKQNERDLYHKAHNIKLNSIHASNDDKIKAAREIEAINLERERSIQNAPQLYAKYLRAVCDEMNNILPDFKEHHETAYHEQIKQIVKVEIK